MPKPDIATPPVAARSTAGALTPTRPQRRRSASRASAARVGLVVSLGALVTGCPHSSEYTPKSTGKARLVMQKDTLMVSKNGAVPENPSEWKPLFACNEQSAQYATTAEEQISSGRSLMVTGAILMPLALLPGAIVASIGRGKLEEGQAAMIDAINSHNDAAACVAAAAATPAAAPALPTTAPPANPTPPAPPATPPPASTPADDPYATTPAAPVQ